MRFIVFEGLDAAGKSTLIEKVSAELAETGIEYEQLRDPGSTSLGEKLRDLILSTEGDAPVAKAETLLYQVARVQMVEKRIKPALKSKWVLCDRFYSSTIAFQVFARNLEMEEIESLNEFVAGDCPPDLFIYLDISVEESIKRKNSRVAQTGVKQDRIEKEKENFQTRVREGYLYQARQSPKNWLVIDATKSPDDLLKIVIAEFRKRKWL